MTESMNQLILARKVGKGGSGGSVTVIDNLNSTSTTAALSANQGRILGLSTTSLDMQLQDEEGTPFYFDKKEGKYGFNTDEERGSDTFHAFGEGGGGSVTVIDNLDSTSSTNALSANMGHTLNTSLTSVSNNLSTFAFRKNPTTNKKEVSSDNGVTWENFNSGAELLWTNSAPTSLFNAQTISLDLIDFDAVKIDFKCHTTNSGIDGYALGYKDIECVGGVKQGNTGASRVFTMTNSGVVFQDAMESTTVWNYDAIPFKIYGIKGDIFNN